MNTKELISNLNKLYPKQLAEEWDNVGLILDMEIEDTNKVLVCLDITNNVVNKAIENKVNLIISHHPLIFRGIKELRKKDLIGSKIIKLIENNISVLSIHTNADRAINGLNDFFVKKVFDQKPNNILNKVVDVNSNIIGGDVRLVNKNTNLGDLAKLLKNKLMLKNIRIIGNENDIVNKIGIMTGSAGHEINNMIKEKVDVYITGDLKHHESLDAKEAGISLIDVGHYETEYIFGEMIKEELETFFDGEVIIYNDENVFEIL